MKNNGEKLEGLMIAAMLLICHKHLGVQGRSKNARKVGGEGTADAGNG